MDLATVRLGPHKTTPFKPLREQPDSVFCSPENLYEIAKLHDIQHTDREWL